ncbi:hypothetical protein J6590_034870 [Homalodisca vitripennis]|nr:hypothetical protein J6590_034870 [Homalodisca vitripennis]
MLSQSETSRMKPYVRADKSFFADAFERLKERRQTLRLEPDPGCFSTRRVSGTIQYFRDDFGGVTSLRFSEGGDRIAVGFNSGELQVCKPALRDRRAGGESLLAGWEGNHSISCVKFHPKRPELLYASSTAGTVLRKDITGNEKYEDFFIIEKNNEIYSFDFGADGAKLITGGRDASIRIYDNVTQKTTLDIPVSSPVLVEISAPYQLTFKSAIQGNLENIETGQGQQSKLSKGTTVWGLILKNSYGFLLRPETLSNLYLEQLPHNLKPYVEMQYLHIAWMSSLASLNQ